MAPHRAHWLGLAFMNPGEEFIQGNHPYRICLCCEAGGFEPPLSGGRRLLTPSNLGDSNPHSQDLTACTPSRIRTGDFLTEDQAS